MRAAFKADGGGAIGLGHLGRCVALAQGLRRLGAKPVFLDVPGDCAAWVRGQGFNTARSGAARWDLLIADSYRFTGADLRRLRARSKTLVLVADSNRPRAACDWILCGRIDAHDFDFSGSSTKGVLLGPGFHLMREEYWKAAATKKIPPRIRRCLITIGGGADSELISRVVSAAARALPAAELHVVLGPVTAPPRGLERLARTTWYRGLKSLRPLMERCDVAVSGGGQTLYELAFCGTPAVALVNAANLDAHVAAMARAGVVLPAGRTGSGLEGRIVQLLTRLDRLPALRRRMSASGRAVVDGKGALRAARILLERKKS